MQELSRLLNGDAKTEVLPIFHVTMVLERTQRVELRPTIQALFDMTNTVARNLIMVLQVGRAGAGGRGPRNRNKQAECLASSRIALQTSELYVQA